MNRRIVYRTSAVASVLALLFMVVACVPLLLFADTVVATPSTVLKVLVSLWSAFWFPVQIIPEVGIFLEKMLLLSSPTPAIKVAPLLFVAWLIWTLLFFLLLALLRRVRRAS